RMSGLASPVQVQDQPADTEDLLLEIWKRALRAWEIDRDSNFFDLGGDSLLAVNMLLEIERKTGVSIPITAIYYAPTVAEMARRLKAANQMIGALILLDAYAHPSTWPVLSRAKMRLRRCLHLFRHALRHSPGATLSRVRRRARAAVAGMGRRSAADSHRRNS